MASKATLAARRLFQEDTVYKNSDPTNVGVVLRCWHDQEDLPPQAPLIDPMLRPLRRGEVCVSYYPDGKREIMPESDFVLVDRCFQAGDFVKRSIDDVRSGIVERISVKAKLAHVISGEMVDGWKTIEDVDPTGEIDVGDYVVYNDWVGQIIELYDEAVIQVTDGHLVRLPEISARLSVGDKGAEILPAPVGVASILGFLMGSNRPNHSDTVLAVNHTVLAVAWLALNQTLSPADAASRQRPPKFWCGSGISQLTAVHGRHDTNLRVGEKVVMRNHDALNYPTTSHAHPGTPGDIVKVRTLQVKETQTTVHVLWQDGQREQLKSAELIHHVNPDEYDCWPGDPVLWKSEDVERAAFVQSVDPQERTAEILFSDVHSRELVSVLELDPHGASLDGAGLDGLGVRRGDFVFVHGPDQNSTNGLQPPRVPRIGEIEEWVRENPIHTDGQLHGWRRAMSDIGAKIATNRGNEVVEDGIVRRAQKHDKWLQWFGQVTSLNLDGTVEVTHPDSSTASYPLQRLTKLHDGLEQLEDDAWDEEMSEGPHPYDDEEMWEMSEDGVWRPHVHEDEDGDWEDTETEDDSMDVEEESEVDAMAMDISDYSNYFESAPAGPVDFSDLPPLETTSLMPQPLTPPPSTPPRPANLSSASTPAQLRPPPVTPGAGSSSSRTESDDGSSWKRFDILPNAPVDHAFYSSVPAQHSRQFLARLTKEYRALSNSLPETIVVRAFEDRADLLRSLIIGPANTPYEDAPFIIDWMLDSNFPNSPPIAHFLSWTNGNGRVNPNLYEEGKVCLSILGTWAGDRNEIWSAARSSLLQAFVSIQGLVLVKEPWFCEPAYEKLRGTEEGIVNSRLYNEKAYVLSRGFVRRALEIPLGGLEQEIEWLYITCGRLDKVLGDARTLMEKSKVKSLDSVGAELDDAAVPRLTGGGIITLGRTLARLEVIWKTRKGSDTPSR